MTLAPGQTNTLKVRLSHESGDTLSGKLFGMRGYPVRRQNADALQVSNITQLVLFVKKSPTDHEFAVAAVQATGEHTPPTAWVTDAEPFFPFIDSFGQYKHKDWPGKVHSLAELQARRTTEAAELAAQPGPTNWDEYGGWNGGPRRTATGFFRTEKVDGKWWLVDPAGNLFWSHGIDCVRLLDATPIAERETWFDDLPADSAATHEFFGRHFALKGHYAGHEVATFNFAGLNLQRKYGPEWRQVYPAVAHQRLRSWGLNTIGNWSDPDICRQHRTPYTDTISSSGATMITGSTGYWGKFPDVFAASFAATLRRAMASKSATSANDPWCLGYFSDNEMSWGDATALAQAALQSPPDQAAKLEFLRVLQAKYVNIGALNAVWGTHHASWDALLASRLAPDKQKAQVDLTAFEEKLAATYFHSVREAIKSVAPHQLYLGCRFAAVNDPVAQAAAKDCDVVSYNLYRRTIADFQFPGGDKPLLVGEFHFGALDRGLFHTGLVPVENQRARAAAYLDYVRGALRHPEFVGTHWFQWHDEPTLGRVYDEENYQIGFVDEADTPYAETIAASRELGQEIYPTRLTGK